MSDYPAPPSFVHVDLDGLWTLAACYGYPEGTSFEDDPIFEYALPRMLDFFDKLGVKATFFIVGRDLELESKRDAVKEILARGHELANHSTSHSIGLESLSLREIRREIEDAQTALTEIAGKAPLGFRAPGYDAGPRTLQTCIDLGLQYDGSRLPTPWAPALRFLAGRLRRSVERSMSADQLKRLKEEEGERAGLTGQSQYGPGDWGAGLRGPSWFRGVRNDGGGKGRHGGDARDDGGGGYARDKGGDKGGDNAGSGLLLRLPLLVSRGLGIPLHASLGMMIGADRIRRGLDAACLEGWPITYLLHGIDLADPAEILPRLPEPLAQSRAFARPLIDRREFLGGVLGHLGRSSRPMLTSTYLQDIKNVSIHR